MGEKHNRKPVVCVETGVEFSSCTEVARYLGITNQHVNALVNQGSSYKGLHYLKKNDPNPPRLKKRSGGCGPEGKRVVCLETGKVYETVNEAVRRHTQGVRWSLRSGGVKSTKEGFHFYYEQDGAPESIEPLRHPGAKPIRCLESGLVYESATAAAREIGVSRQYVLYAVANGKKIRGFSYVEVLEEEGR